MSSCVSMSGPAKVQGGVAALLERSRELLEEQQSLSGKLRELAAAIDEHAAGLPLEELQEIADDARSQAGDGIHLQNDALTSLDGLIEVLEELEAAERNYAALISGVNRP